MSEDTLNLLFVTFVAALIADVSMLLGVAPFVFLKDMPERFSGLFSAGAAGMMAAAALVQLIHEGLERAPGWGVLEVGGGMLAGGLLYLLASCWVKNREDFDVLRLRESGGTRALLIVAVMTIHSLPEGISIGVAFGSEERALGYAVVSALAVHNIPEAIAITLALRAGGVGLRKTAGWVLLTSVPQPLAAPFAAWAVHAFEAFLPAGMGLAAGAMTFLVIDDLLPEALEKTTPTMVAAAFLIGCTAMVALGRAFGL